MKAAEVLMWLRTVGADDVTPEELKAISDEAWARRQSLARRAVHVGQWVEFDLKGGKVCRAVVQKLNKKTANVDDCYIVSGRGKSERIVKTYQSFRVGYPALRECEPVDPETAEAPDVQFKRWP